MAVGIYVLHLHPAQEEMRRSFLREAAECVDEVRREKTERLKGTGAKAASLGAGMLLQKMAMDLTEGIENTDILFLEEDELLAVLQARMRREQTLPFPFSYEYGEQGKPQIVNFPKNLICLIPETMWSVGLATEKWEWISKMGSLQRVDGRALFCKGRVETIAGDGRGETDRAVLPIVEQKRSLRQIYRSGDRQRRGRRLFRRAQMEGKEDLLPGTDFGSGVFAGGLLRNSRSVKFKENGK